MAHNLFAQDKQLNYPGSEQSEGIVHHPAQEQQQTVPATVQSAQKTAIPIPAIDTNSPTSGMDAISQMYTSPQEEERLRRASVANQRILAVGDALRHIGNIYNTVRYAPAQKFNSPVMEEYDRYQKGKALRDAANLKYYTYQQAKEAQDAKARQWENNQEYKNKMLQHYQDQDKRLWFTANANATNQQALRSLQQQKLELDKMYKEHKIETDKYNAESRRISAQAAALRAANSGSSSGSGMGDYEVITENTRDGDGRIISQKKTRTVKRGGQSVTTTKTTKKGSGRTGAFSGFSIHK